MQQLELPFTFKELDEELKVYDNLQFIHEVLGKELITTLEGETMTLAEWRLKNGEPKKYVRLSSFKRGES